ncbi:hypothetical protein ACROYT_G007860 [Oculina patagonica]
MIKIALWIALLGCAITFAASRECYECHTTASMEDCVQFMKKVRCPRETDRCRNMTVQVYVRLLKENVTYFQRGCASQDECVFSRCSGHAAEKMGEKALAYNMCQMSCCDGDFCPEGNVTRGGGSPGGPPKGARSGCDVVHPVSFSVAASIVLSLIRAVFP